LSDVGHWLFEHGSGGGKENLIIGACFLEAGEVLDFLAGAVCAAKGDCVTSADTVSCSSAYATANCAPTSAGVAGPA